MPQIWANKSRCEPIGCLVYSEEKSELCIALDEVGRKKWIVGRAESQACRYIAIIIDRFEVGVLFACRFYMFYLS